MNREVLDHLDSAAECITDAEVLLERGRYRAVVGRGYYAVFHAATAALLQRGIERRSHHAIISAFGEFLVKTDDVVPKCDKFIREMFDLRLESD